MEHWHLYVLLGLGCGIFGATFGVGSGVIMVPALVLLAGLSQKSAQGISLAVIAPMALVGAIRYKLNPQVGMDMLLIAVLALGAVAGAMLGSSIAGWLSGAALRRLFAIILIALSVKMLLTPEAPQAPSGGATPGAGAPAVEAEKGPGK